MRATLLVVDDDANITELLGHTLRAQGYDVEAVPDGERALARLSELVPDALILDLGLPGSPGLVVLATIRARYPWLPVVILTGETDVQMVVASIKGGAWDYLPKPIDRTKLLTTVHNAVDHGRMSRRLAQLEREAGGAGYPGLVGSSPAMQGVFRQLDRLVASDISVLVRGESGTGKELVARAIHGGSGRKLGPFVAVNCAAVPETLQESELFGHERGAFTGAVQRQTGRFEEAHEGTLFLDEIAELSPSAQAKLLRVLQERRFRRVGSSEEQASDFRLVAATHRDLHAEVQAGRFREDLYFRIAVFELELPPLRARGDDVVLLAERVLARAAAQEGRSLRLSEDARAALASHDWPGNVRELENAVARAVVASDGPVLQLEHLPPRVQAAFERPPQVSLPIPRTASSAVASGPAVDLLGGRYDLETIERMAITRALARHPNNLRGVVEELGLSRTTLYRKLKQYKLEEKA